MTDFSIIRRSLTSRLFSTASTVLTVAVAVALMLVLLSMRDAGRRSLERGSGNMHLLVSADTSPLTSVLNAVFYARAPARALPLTRATELGKNPMVEWALPVAQGDNYKGYPTLAVPREFFGRFEPVAGQPFKLAAGKFPADDFDIVLGAAAARGSGLAIGDKVVVTHGTGSEGGHEHDEHPYVVSAVLAPTGTAHDRAVFISLVSTWIMHADDFRKKRGDPEEPTAANLRESEKLITGIYVRGKGRAGSDTPATLPQLFSELRSDPTLTVASPSQQIDQLFKIIGNIDKLFIAIAGVVLLSSAVTIMLVMHNTMELRKRQIAVLRVLGASRGRVFSLVLTESAILGLLGAGLGVALAAGGAVATAAAVRGQLGLVIEPRIEVLWAVVLVGASVGLACLAGLLPAVRAYRTNVLASLRPAA
ncbi:ABC transporter permease [Synechococcus sp. Cruz CV-v-12]|uniref:ABC transporter permease n=1 Tax=Synechococcus sp. Cruz CV-v-12 TaxID=2823728 RepID=UPI0020CDDE53|nr:ABC transporter permease [Synechococcus sp. Cruz CV-v-12]MCP9874827.1 ABC transporter permease [Synechococcus sp. Cruz CV-v-12]